MRAFTNRIQKLDIPGDLPMHFEAHYDVEVEGDCREASYKIDLGYVEWSLAGKLMPDMEGGEIPLAVKRKILAAITVSEDEIAQALQAAEDEAAHVREHAVGL